MIDRQAAALADPSRRMLLRAILALPGVTTGELAGVLPTVTRWTVTKHLDVLRSAGLVKSLPDGRRRRHYGNADALAPLAEWIAEARALRPG